MSIDTGVDGVDGVWPVSGAAAAAARAATNSISSPPLETHLRGRVPLGRNRNVPASKKCPPRAEKFPKGAAARRLNHSQGGRRYSVPESQAGPALIDGVIYFVVVVDTMLQRQII